MLGDILLNRYRMENKLGQGGMGVVYRAQDTLLNRPVAIKLLNATGLGTAGKARLLAEARAAAKLNHPNIVAVYDAGEADGAPFIVMELVPGETLREHTPQNYQETVGLVSQVCAALEHAHAAGVIHSDLKPENIILTPSKTVKLMDFGLARISDGPRLTEDGALMGTFLYMAPELLMGQEASVQSDLYALGVMLYELACGQPPFKGDDPLALISQHLHADPIPPSTYNPSIPLGIETLILKLLSKEPADRPVSAAEVRLSLEKALAPDQKMPPAAAPLDRMVRGRLVGRERELADAIQLWNKVQQGESGLLLISGEPGIGKSRLARELMVQVQMAHGLPLVGESYAEGSAPYATFAQMILGIADWPADLPALVLADLISLAPGLRVRYPEIPPNPALDPQAEQQRMYESAFTFFARLAQRAPLLLVLEDVHWADGGTLTLLRSLARRFRQANTPVLVVLTFRESELAEHKGLTDLLNGWNHERLATTIKLYRLDETGTQAMLEALFAEAVTVDFARDIYRETEGNPFFIEEICKALVEGNQVYRENGRWQRSTLSPLEMPRSIRMAIETRLGCLPASSQEVLHLAAVLGRRFEFEVLQAAYMENTTSGSEEEALIAALEEAEKAQLLNELGRGGGVFEFAHALIPTTLTEGLSGMRRRRLHRRAIVALEKLHPEDVKALALHCLQAGEDERALDFLLKAAAQARAAFANAEAVTNYQQALGLLNELLHENSQAGHWRVAALQLHEDLGDVLELTGQHEEAWISYQSALTLIPSGEPIRKSRLYRKISTTRQTLRLYDEAAQAYQLAETALGAESAEATSDWRQEWIMIQLDRIGLDYWRGWVPEMTALAEKVRPDIERYGTPLQRCKFFNNLALMTYRRDRYVISDETFSYNTQALTAAQQADSPTDLAWTHFLVGFSHLWHLDLDEAEEYLQTSLRILEQIGDVTLQSRSLTYLTVTNRKRGNIEKVRKYARQSQDAAAIGQMIEYTSMAQANLAWVARREGELAEARQLAETAWETMQKTTQAQMFNWVAVWPLVGVCLAQERILEAVGYARQLFLATTQPQPEALATLLLAAIQAWEQSQSVQARALLTQAVPLAEQLGYL